MEKPETPYKDRTAAEREEYFHERYGEDVDAAATLVELVKACGAYLERIVGKEPVAVAMVPIVETLAGCSPFEPSDWAETLDEHTYEAFSTWPIGERLFELAAYAVYGIVIGDREASEPEAYIDSLITAATTFLAESPVKQWRVGAEGQTELEDLVLWAKNRWALDHKEPVDPKALARFGGLSERSIRNMMAGGGKTFNAVDGRIPAYEALAWLETRDEYWNSIWREQPEPSHAQEPEEPVENPIFVPVARGGSVFHPGVERNGRFTVGPKGDERQVGDFEQALEELQRMPSPFWRRPNDKNAYGIVRGVRWVRLDRAHLASIACDRTFKFPATD